MGLTVQETVIKCHEEKTARDAAVSEAWPCCGGDVGTEARVTSPAIPLSAIRTLQTEPRPWVGTSLMCAGNRKGAGGQ